MLKESINYFHMNIVASANPGGDTTDLRKHSIMNMDHCDPIDYSFGNQTKVHRPSIYLTADKSVKMFILSPK
jgi:hypothetical protein